MSRSRHRFSRDAVNALKIDAQFSPPFARQASSAFVGPPSPEMRSTAASIAFKSTLPQSGSGFWQASASTQARNVASSRPTIASAASFSLTRRAIAEILMPQTCRPFLRRPSVC